MALNNCILRVDGERWRVVEATSLRAAVTAIKVAIETKVGRLTLIEPGSVGESQKSAEVVRLGAYYLKLNQRGVDEIRWFLHRFTTNSRLAIELADSYVTRVNEELRTKRRAKVRLPADYCVLGVSAELPVSRFGTSAYHVI